MTHRALAVVGMVLLFGCDRSSARRSVARITASPNALDFGTQVPGARATQSFTLTNVGSATLHLTSLALRDDLRGAFSVSEWPQALDVGGSVLLTVTYAAPLADGVDGASIEIESDAENAQQLLVALGGRSLAPCVASRSYCAGTCVDAQSDPAHCGGCDRACAAGQLCVAGTCAPCTANSQCASGLACVGGACGPCGMNSHCTAGQVCVAGTCRACADASECSSGQVCLQGVCGACATNADCAPGAACVSGACGPCTGATQCQAGQGCVSGACTLCTTNSSCANAQVCVSGSCGTCTANAQCDPGQACVSGACGPCATSAQCDSGQVCLNGACAACTASAQCASGQVCLSGVCRTCASSSECASGQVCLNGSCGPCTSSSECTSGQVCVAGACGACTGSAQCSGGQVCRNGSCQPCASNTECASGQACVAGACGACTLDVQCGAGEACFSGSCGPCVTDFCTMKGLILPWAGTIASIPTGWVLADGQGGTPDLRGLFLKGAPPGTNSGATGGSLTHIHGGATGTVTVTTAASGTAVCGVSVGGCSWIENPNSHTHTLQHAHAIPPASHLPQYFEALFIVKRDALLRPPDGLIVGWGAPSSPSGGWLPLDGVAAVPDLRNRFLRGAGPGINPGGIGGSLTHNHDGGTAIDSTPTSIAGVGLTSFAGNCGTGCATSGQYGHWHLYPHAHRLAAASNDPPFMLVNWVTAANADSFPAGAIAMWNGSVVAPPRGWSVCDGTNGTPDLSGRFLKGAASGATPGTSGGSQTHTHGGGSTEPEDGGVTDFADNTNSPAGGSAGQSVHQHGVPGHLHPIALEAVDPPYFEIIFLMKR